MQKSSFALNKKEDFCMSGIWIVRLRMSGREAGIGAQAKIGAALGECKPIKRGRQCLRRAQEKGLADKNYFEIDDIYG